MKEDAKALNRSQALVLKLNSDFVVHTLAQYPENETSLKMEVGIEDCLHIEFEYNRSRLVLSVISDFSSMHLKFL